MRPSTSWEAVQDDRVYRTTEKSHRDFTSLVRFQRDWIERRGLFLWAAFVTGGLGAGTYLVALFAKFPEGFPLGLLIGFLIVAFIKLPCHIAFLGRPERFWRAFFKPQNSWISRGVIGVVVFVISAIFYVLPFYVGVPWGVAGAPGAFLRYFTIAGAVYTMTYSGVLMATVPAIPFWNNPIVPLFFVGLAFLGGNTIALILSPWAEAAGISISALEAWESILLVLVGLILGVYLITAYWGPAASREAVRAWLRGWLALPFYIGLVVLGIVAPLVVGLWGYFLHMPYIGTLIGGILELGGATFISRYILFKAGGWQAPLVGLQYVR